MALSLERWLEIADSKKRLEKLSDKFKTVCVLIYIVIVCAAVSSEIIVQYCAVLYCNKL